MQSKFPQFGPVPGLDSPAEVVPSGEPRQSLLDGWSAPEFSQEGIARHMGEERAYKQRNEALISNAVFQEQTGILCNENLDLIGTRLSHFYSLAGQRDPLWSPDSELSEYLDTAERVFTEWRKLNPLSTEELDKRARMCERVVKAEERRVRKEREAEYKAQYAVYVQACRARRERIAAAEAKRDAVIAAAQAEYKLAASEPLPAMPLRPSA